MGTGSKGQATPMDLHVRILDNGNRAVVLNHQAKRSPAMHLITITTVLLFLPAMVFSAPLAKGQNGGIVVGAVDCQKSLNKCRINPDANRSTWYVAATSFVMS